MIFMQDFLDKLKSAVDPLVLLGLRRLRCLSFRMGGETQVGCGISGTMTQHHIVFGGKRFFHQHEFEDGQNHNNLCLQYENLHRNRWLRDRWRNWPRCQWKVSNRYRPGKPVFESTHLGLLRFATLWDTSGSGCIQVPDGQLTNVLWLSGQRWWQQR